MKPIHEHDCQNCKFIGRINLMDAYYCVHKNGDGTTYILRNSGLDSDYASLEDFNDKLLNEDKRRHRYSSSFTPEEIALDRYRRVLIKLLTGTIANSMERCDCCD